MVANPSKVTPEIASLFNQVVVPTLEETGSYSLPASQCVTLLTITESAGLKYRRQLGGGPALGLWQMERPTFDWLHDQKLPRRPIFRDGLRAIVDRILGEGTPITFDLLEHCDPVACAFARLRLLADPKPIGNTLVDHARTWKRVYNTVQGKGTVAKAIADVAHYAPGLYPEQDWIDAAAFLANTPEARSETWA